LWKQVVTTPDRDTAAPLRTCLGCRRRLTQSKLVRCVAGPDGATISRTADGRGAWLCSIECLAVASRRKAFDRAWKRTVGHDELHALQIAFDGVIINMEELPAVGVTTVEPAATKG